MNFKKLGALLALMSFPAQALAVPTDFKTDTLRLGNPANTTANKIFEMNKGSGATNPKLRWNGTSGFWEFTNDGTNYKKIGSGSGGGVGALNGLQDLNFDFEQGVTGWTASAGSFSAVTSGAQYEGNYSGEWTPAPSTAAGQNLRSSAVTMAGNPGLKGIQCMAVIFYKGDTQNTNNGAIQLEAWDGTNVLNAGAIPSSTSAYTITSVNFPCPTTGSVYLRETTTTVTPSSGQTPVDIDVAYLGTAINLSTVILSRAPTQQRFTSGSGVYSLPQNPAPLYIRVRMVGGGGGGAGTGTSGATNGGTGGTTTFGSSLLTANGGVGAVAGAGNSGGAGGSATVAAGATGIGLTGGAGGGASNNTTSVATAGGAGGNSAFGGGGSSNGLGAGGAGVTNTGGGGGGAGQAANYGAAGGGAGGFVDATISAPSNTFAYAVGLAGTAGGAGAGGNGGGLGGSGLIIVDEFYQSAQTTYLPTNGGLSAGEIVKTASATCPVGTVPADGMSYATAQLPALFAALGYSYGGSGANFNVPDFRWNFDRGFGGNVGGTPTVVSAVTGLVTMAGHGFNHSGVPVRFTGFPPTGLSSANTTYYVIYVDANNIKFATTRANAMAGTAIIPAAGTITFTAVQWADPDASSRLALATGGNTGNALGSFQGEGTAVNGLFDNGHTHAPNSGSAFITYGGGTSDVPAGSAVNAVNGGNSATASGTANLRSNDNETRPRNIYVNYCIRTTPASPSPIIVGQGPTVQKFTSGSGTYVTPAGVKYIKVELLGAGGGGGPGGTSTAGGGAGGNTTFGSSLLVANGGSGGVMASGAGVGGGAGGTASVSAPALQLVAISGATGGGSGLGSATVDPAGGDGGASPLGGAGSGGSQQGNGGDAVANSGSGGGGGSTTGQTNGGGGGGGAGGFVRSLINSPAGSYSYSIGTAGANGTGTKAGGNGSAGYIVVEEYYN